MNLQMWATWLRKLSTLTYNTSRVELRAHGSDIIVSVTYWLGNVRLGIERTIPQSLAKLYSEDPERFILDEILDRVMEDRKNRLQKISEAHF